jgi:hypothetical protein
MGFLVLDPPAGTHDIRLEFVTPLESVVGRIVTVLTLAMVTLLAVRDGKEAKQA